MSILAVGYTYIVRRSCDSVGALHRRFHPCFLLACFIVRSFVRSAVLIPGEVGSLLGFLHSYLSSLLKRKEKKRLSCFPSEGTKKRARELCFCVFG
jgi:hypothetical protein